LEEPLIDSFGVEGHRDAAELLSYSMVRGMASVGGPVTNSGGVLRFSGEAREEQREIGRV
jgi:hypothetical protein